MTIMTAKLNTTNENTAIELGKQAKILWKAWLKAGNQPNATHMAIYALLRGKSLNKTFTPVSNPEKIANGMDKWFGRDRAIHAALTFYCSYWEPFSSLIEAETKSTRWGEKSYDYTTSELLTQLREKGQAALRED